MRFDKESKIVYVRQSWLNDLIICPERARLKLVRPDLSGPSDATIMGTALHYGIEQVLAGASVASLGTIALEHWEELKAQPYKVTNLDPDKSVGQILGMAQAFADGILPEVQLGGDVEYKFKYPMGVTVDDWEVWCEGTMDYLQPDGTIWDWKTASMPKKNSHNPFRQLFIAVQWFMKAERHILRISVMALWSVKKSPSHKLFTWNAQRNMSHGLNI